MSFTSTNLTALLFIWGFVMIEIVNSDQQCLKIKNKTVISHHEHEEFNEKFYKTINNPRMEILAVGLKYDNETAKLSVSVYVEFPEFSISDSVHRSKSTSVSATTHSAGVEYFTDYTISLYASISPPPNCDNFDKNKKHSERNVHYSHSTHCNGTLMSNVLINGIPIICIDVGKRNFTVVFDHVHSAYYNLDIQANVNDNGPKYFDCYTHYQTSKNWSNALLPEWSTLIGIEPVPDKQSIHVIFQWPKFIIKQIKVDLILIRAIDDSCSKIFKPDYQQILPITMKHGELDAVITFSNATPGNYCAAIEPLDERCLPEFRFWKKSCRRYSGVFKIKEPDGNPVPPFPPPKDPPNLWIIIYFVCAFAVCLLLGSLLGISYRHRQKKRERHRAQQVIVEGGASTEVSPTDVISLKKIIDEKDSQTPASSETLSAKHSVLLLYRRDDAQVSSRATELRKRMQFDCGNKIKIYDYGDESQWDEMSTEGPNWLPNRICGNNIADGCVNRVIVIHSPKQLDCQEKLVLSDHNDTSENTNPLLDEVDHENLNIHDEFLYGIRLLQSFTHSDSLYRRVFNVRYTDIVDCESFQTENLVYADLTIAPFTCYLLPGNYKQLLEHITSTQ